VADREDYGQSARYCKARLISSHGSSPVSRQGKKALGDWQDRRLRDREFYKRFIGFNHVPDGLREWQAIPEENLAAATNGKFSWTRRRVHCFQRAIEEIYPEDLRLKKIASRCMTMASQANIIISVAYGVLNM